MAIVLPVSDVFPIFGKTNLLAPNATVTGNVRTGDDCSFWFNSVVRGDVNAIVMGDRVNVQDGAIIHCTYEKFSTTIGNNVSIGHRAIVHGCTIHDNVLIGMGAIIMDGAVIGSNTIIAAGALVLENTVVESGVVFGGLPGKVLKNIPADLVEGEINRIARNYTMYASWYGDNFEVMG
ncbi:MAG: gamma carbonic anhydrase family protein [Saprospiraceae bacterium]|nr:gamma carbonic anhydrase family protein [Saprospiraceae bacterium]